MKERVQIILREMAELLELEAKESFPMTGGDGPYSYAKNSNPLKEEADRAKDLLVTGIVENLDIQIYLASNIFRIADLGCSVGPNTFIAMNNIIQSIKHKYQISNSTTTLPEFQVLFNDHFSNDFNTLFNTIPSDGSYFPAGVPGSFHQRLFPKACLNFVYSSFAIQWLSKVPQELGNTNRGRIHYAHASKEVGEAYSAQFFKDMDAYFGARAQEMAPGGLMALLLPGRPDRTLPAESSVGPFFYYLEACLIDMAKEGLLSESKLDSFNLPIYSPSPEELQKIVAKHGCFSIVKIEQMPPKAAQLLTVEGCRSGFEKVIETHFGCEIVEQVFNRYAKKIVGKPLLTADDGIGISLFVLLKFKL